MTQFFMQSFAQGLGWTLLHFIWQGALVALLIASANFALRHATANARYLASCAGLLLMAILPILTFAILVSDFPTTGMISNKATISVPTIVNRQTGPAIDKNAYEQTTTSNTLSSFLDYEALNSKLSAWIPFLVLVWLSGVFLLSIRAVGGWVLVQRLKRRCNTEAIVEWQETVTRLARRMRVSRPVRLCESALAEVPTVIGWLRPVILVPVGTLTGLSAQQVEALLAHELAHIRRHDYLVNLAQVTIETLFFYHPAVWWVSHRIRTEREHCCDDLAVATCGNVLAYARALAELEGLRSNENPQLAMAADGGSLLRRIRRILGVPLPPQRSTAWLNSLLIILMIAFVSTGAIRVAKPVVKAGVEAKNYIAKKIFGPDNNKHNHQSQSAQSSTQDKPTLPQIRAGVTVRGNFSELENTTGEQGEIAPTASAEETPSGNAPTGPMPEMFSGPLASPTPPQNKDEEESGDFIDELAAEGYTNLKADNLVAMKIHGVTGKFIREMREQGFGKLSVDSLTAFRVHGVTSDFAREMKAAFGPLDADDLIAMSIHDVTPQFANEMRPLVNEKLSVDDLVAFRIHGVSPALVKEFESLGFTKLDADDLIAIKIHGLTAKYVQDMQGLGLGKLSLEQLLALRIHGVTPAFIKKVRQKGFTDLTLDQIIELKNLGIIRDSGTFRHRPVPSFILDVNYYIGRAEFKFFKLFNAVRHA